jgi:hypothetical protein
MSTEANYPGRAGQMFAADGNTIVLQTSRPPAVIARDGEDCTISAEALDDLGRATQQWTLSRIMRKLEATGKTAHAVKLEVTVRLDGEEGEPDTPLRLVLPIDGSTRIDLGGAK